MNNLLKGITYSYNRNIGWQDRSIRTIVGILSIVGLIYFFNNPLYAFLFGVLAIAQFGTVLSAKCILCYYLGKCTIDKKEQKQLKVKGIPFETIP